MGYLMRLVSGILLLSISISGWADCEGLNEKLVALLKDKKYAEAEQLALAEKVASPDDIKASLALAYVYVRQALPPKVLIDTQAMGLGEGETGTIQLKEGDVNKFFKDVAGHNPEYGAKAEQSFKEIISKWRFDKRAYWCLMNYYQQSGRHNDLVAFIPAVVKAFNGEGYALVDQLLPYPARYANDENYRGATAFYIELLKHFPKSASVTSSYGYVKLRTGDLSGAIELFDKAYLLDKQDPIILSNLANSYLYARDFKKSEMYFHELIKANPKATEAYFNLAILAMSENIPGSKKAWESYLKQNEKFPDDEQWVGLAKELSQHVVKGISDTNIYQLSINLNNAKATAYSIPLLVYLDKKNPEQIYNLFGLAQAYEYAGIPLVAYGYVTRAAALVNKAEGEDKTDTASVSFEAGRLACMLEKYDEALVFLRTTERQDENFKGLQYMLGLANEHTGNEKEAIKQYELCMKKDTNKQYLGYCKNNYSRLAKQ